MPKFEPVIVTAAPTGPLFGLMPVIDGVTVKLATLLFSPATVTNTFPTVALEGTGATMLVSLQVVGVVAAPAIVTVLVPCDAPKSVPVIVTEVPIGPAFGLTLVIVGVTEKRKGLLAIPFTVTSKLAFPAANPYGTVTTILVGIQLEAVAAIPANVTVLVP